MDHDIGVLDVNIPEHITSNDNPIYRTDSNAEQARKEAEKLATYLWENYIEPYDHDRIFFIGIGNAFHGIVKLLTERGLWFEYPLLELADPPCRRGVPKSRWCNRIHCKQPSSTSPQS